MYTDGFFAQESSIEPLLYHTSIQWKSRPLYFSFPANLSACKPRTPATMSATYENQNGTCQAAIVTSQPCITRVRWRTVMTLKSALAVSIKVRCDIVKKRTNNVCNCSTVVLAGQRYGYVAPPPTKIVRKSQNKRRFVIVSA